MPKAQSRTYHTLLPSVALAVVFLVVTAGIIIYKLLIGNIMMPRLLPEATDLTSVLKLFTAIPVLVTAYIRHYNGFEKPSTIQQRGIVPFFKGLDVIQQAQPGTGITETFCSGIL